MNPERLLEHYHRIADAEDAVPRLRRFVLDLAVRGKLVEQDPADEPAAELLKRIAANRPKKKLVKPVASNKENTDREGEGAAPGWTTSRLDAVSNFENGDRSSNYPSGPDIKLEGVPFFSTKNLSDFRLQFANLDFITQKKFDSLRSGKLHDFDILITLRGSVGKFGLFKATKHISTGFINAQLLIIRCLNPELVPYVVTFMKSDDFAKQISLLSSGAATPQLSAGKLGEVLVPLPPLAEQHHIVAKVDELMALCDQLEAARSEREATRDRLTAASLVRLTAPGTGHEDFSAYARFALGALPALTARPGQIKALRQTILNLAVRGKLVEQNPADEPAAELLKRIATEKATSGKRQKKLPESDAEQLGVIPKNWCDVPLIALGEWAIGSGFPKNEQGQSDGPYFFLKVSDMNLSENEKYITTANNYIDDDAAKRMRAAIHPPGTIIFPKIGGAIATNKRRILTRGSAIDNNCLGLIFSSQINTEWAYLLMTTLDFTLYQAGTAVPALQQGTLAAIAVALPPLAEQHRIVAKVDELMALCDRLEITLTAADTTRAYLLEALLHEALTPAARAVTVAAE